MKITLKCGAMFEANKGEVILDQALENNIFLSHSCKTGQCDSCKTMIISGETAILKPEIALKQEDIESGYILTCCRSALSDLTLNSINLEKFALIKKARIPVKILNICSKEMLVPSSIKTNTICGVRMGVKWVA